MVDGKHCKFKYWLVPDFQCEITEDCQGHGICDDSGKCLCHDNWKSKADCSGNYSGCLEMI